MDVEIKENRLRYGNVLDEETERIARELVDAIFAVHSYLGPGLIESVYVECLLIELELRGIKAQREVQVPIVYRGRTAKTRLRIDLLVEGRIIVEAKAIENKNDLFKLKTRTYLRLAGLRLGFLVNFNVALIKDGITRIIL